MNKMGLQEILVLIIVSIAVYITIYKLIRIIIKKDKDKGICSSCPYSTKGGTCSKK